MMSLRPSIFGALQLSSARACGVSAARYCCWSSYMQFQQPAVGSLTRRVPHGKVVSRSMCASQKSSAKQGDEASQEGISSEKDADLVTFSVRLLPDCVTHTHQDFTYALQERNGKATDASEMEQDVLLADAASLAAVDAFSNIRGFDNERQIVYNLLERRRHHVGFVYSKAANWKLLLSSVLVELKNGNELTATMNNELCHCLDDIQKAIDVSPVQRLLHLSRLLSQIITESAQTADFSETRSRALEVCQGMIRKVGRDSRLLTVTEYSSFLQVVVESSPQQMPTWTVDWWKAVVASYQAGLQNHVSVELMWSFLCSTTSIWHSRLHSSIYQQMVGILRHLLANAGSQSPLSFSSLIKLTDDVAPLRKVLIEMPEFLSSLPPLETVSSRDEAELIMDFLKSSRLEGDVRLSSSFVDHLSPESLLQCGNVLALDRVIVPKDALSSLVRRVRTMDLSRLSTAQAWSLANGIDALGVTNQEVYCALLKQMGQGALTFRDASNPQLPGFARTIAARLHGPHYQGHIVLPEVRQFWKKYRVHAHYSIEKQWFSLLQMNDVASFLRLLAPMWELAESAQSETLKVYIVETLSPLFASNSWLQVLPELDLREVLRVSSSHLCGHPDLSRDIIISLATLPSMVKKKYVPIIAEHCLETSDKDAFRVFYTSLGSSVTGALVALKLESLLKCFLAMIQTNVIDIPEHQQVLELYRNVLLRKISTASVNQYCVQADMAQLMSVSSACLNDPSGRLFYACAPAAVSQQAAWAELLRPLHEAAVAQKIDNRQPHLLRQAVQLSAANGNTEACRRLLLVISDFLLSETDALTPETLSEANVCLRTALIDDVNTAEFEVLSGHFQSVAERLALLAARDYAKWSKAVIDFVRHATRVKVISDPLVDLMCLAVVNKELDIWQIVPVFIDLNRDVLPLSLSEPLLTALGDRATVAKNVTLKTLPFLVRWLPGLFVLGDAKANAMRCLRDFVLSEQHMHDEAFVGNAAVELLGCMMLQTGLNSADMQPLVASILSLPNWCLRTLRLESCNRIFLLPALKDLTAEDVHPYHDWFVHIPDLLYVELSEVWKRRSFPFFSQKHEQAKQFSDIFNFFQSASYAIVAGLVCGTPVHAPYAFDMQPEDTLHMAFNTVSESEPGMPMNCLLRLVAAGLLDADVMRRPERHFMFETCLNALTDGDLFKTKVSDHGFHCNATALLIAIQLHKHTAACADKKQSSLANTLAQVEKNVRDAVDLNDGTTKSKFMANRVSLSKSLASLFQDKSCVVDPARLDLPINVAAVCALDDQGVPVAVEEEEVESDSRPSPDSQTALWPDAAQYRIAMVVSPEREEATSEFASSLDELLLNYAVKEQLKQLDFSCVDVPADLARRQMSLEGKYVEDAELSYVARERLRQVLVNTVRNAPRRVSAANASTNAAVA
ncbi:uncharacterized protein LOC135809742 [Sycon ciliatum]|uniref:uncharacterized protein LOC135809742 n=1 Tax=Sycon ciliatum TaxID=27933 RepID=UPI0031F663E1